MIGGTVIEVAEMPNRPGVLFIDCADFPKGRRTPDTCAIVVESNEISNLIQLGDFIWWQSRCALWTPWEAVVHGKRPSAKCGIDFDIQIRRIGPSGVKYPRESLHNT